MTTLSPPRAILSVVIWFLPLLALFLSISALSPSVFYPPCTFAHTYTYNSTLIPSPLSSSADQKIILFALRPQLRHYKHTFSSSPLSYEAVHPCSSQEHTNALSLLSIHSPHTHKNIDKHLCVSHTAKDASDTTSIGLSNNNFNNNDQSLPPSSSCSVSLVFLSQYDNTGWHDTT
ncbi:MAG: hypothetical protein J3R72DRAFT_237211 [Linnemannia gamsii]|nr:MAG: hypothetical protein J3R72DRAFT_237211 [Linnemannia gamsii]